LSGGPALAGARAQLLRFAAGARFPSHRHTGTEIVFVLEGSYVDSNERTFGPGDQQILEAGTEHTLRISPDGPCIAAVVSGGVEFTGWLLGTLQKLWPGR
jgi:anti-sigma factor ChrR (cupin superfamily)